MAPIDSPFPGTPPTACPTPRVAAEVSSTPEIWYGPAALLSAHADLHAAVHMLREALENREMARGVLLEAGVPSKGSWAETLLRVQEERIRELLDAIQSAEDDASLAGAALQNLAQSRAEDAETVREAEQFARANATLRRRRTASAMISWQQQRAMHVRPSPSNETKWRGGLAHMCLRVSECVHARALELVHAHALRSADLPSLTGARFQLAAMTTGGFAPPLPSAAHARVPMVDVLYARAILP